MIGTLSKYPKLATIYKKTEKSFLSRMEEFGIIFQTDQSSVIRRKVISNQNSEVIPTLILITMIWQKPYPKSNSVATF